MYTSIAGIYRDGRVELVELPALVSEEAPVIVTFLNGNVVDLHAYGIDEQQAADLRSRLASFAAEWDSPEMDVYDNYDAANSSRQAG